MSQSKYKRNTSKWVGAAVIFVALAAIVLTASAQLVAPVGVTRPTLPAAVVLAGSNAANDSIDTAFPVQQTSPETYESLLDEETPMDLKTPTNIMTVPEYDPLTKTYVIRTKVGEHDIATPFILSENQFNNWQLRQSMSNYYQEKNRESFEQKEKEPFNILDMNFALGPLEKIFGPGGVRLQTQGSIQLNMGVNSNKTDNPSLSLESRRKTYFDFDQKIQATITASVGNRLKFNMTYNTDATFDFDSQNLRLGYDGEEDDIVKTIEAGNVSMTTGSSLIRGSTALFGVKTQLQFGKLTATALVSQQNSESKTISTKGGVQTTEFTVNADQYDQNRHFFLAQYFYDNYDQFASKLPFVLSGIQITRLEVWVTNKSNNYNNSRNLVAFADLGESSGLTNNYWLPNTSVAVPTNQSNNLLSVIKNEYPGARDINTVTQALEPLREYGIEGGKDYEKIESARLLTSSEYTYNATLGYISIKSQLNSDEVLAVAFEYTYNGQVYQVGEFSSDVTSTSQSLYVKMLKSTTVDPNIPMWRLMMKNVYSLGAYQVQKNNFRLNIKYLSDTTGTMINYLPVSGLTNQSLLQVMNLDRLDSNEESNPDGFFDYLEGYTIISSTGKIIFPVVEPFGSHLEKKIGNPAVAQQYVYKELYDSTLVVAQQFADKNKFVLTGEYQASNGSQIRLNAMNVPRGSVVVTAGGVQLVENSDYTVDYSMGIVTITNQSIIDSGQNVSVTLENQSLFSMQRKTLLGLDLQYAFSKNFNVGATIMHFSEKALTEKVGIGNELINNSMFGFNVAYNTEFMWLTNLLNKIPTVNATAPSKLSLVAEYAQLVPHAQKSGSTKGSSYLDDFENAQIGIDLRSPYSWFLASTPYDGSASALFPEASLSNNVDYGKNRAMLNWYTIDRMFTDKNSSLCPGYLRADLKQLSNPYVREVTSREIWPGRELNYGESNIVQTLNLSFYPTERGPYNLDATNIDAEGNLLNPEKRWGGIMRRMENTNFEQSNIEYIQFWMMNPFLDPENPNQSGGDLYFNLGEISEDILKDGLKSYENGIPVDGNNEFIKETVWGNVSSENSLTYSFDNNAGSRNAQDVGIDGLKNDQELSYPTYQEYLTQLNQRLNPETVASMMQDQFSPFNDPAGDNYHFFRGYDYDDERTSILDRYKHYNGVEGNSLNPEDAPEALYQSARSVPDVEDINQDNTLNEYERYFQYRVSIRPEDLVVGKNYITDRQTSIIPVRDGTSQEVEWFQFKIPLSDFEKVVGSIKDFSSIRFARIYMTGFKEVTHLRFATLELIRGEWRPYKFNLNTRGDTPAEGELDLSVVNIEENASRQPVNYVLPPGVTRAVDPGQSQITQLNEQSLSMRVSDLDAGDARAIYLNTQRDLRNYKRIQMWVHAEQFIDDVTDLRDGDLSIFIRLGSDVKNNFYEYEVPLTLTPEGKYNNNLTTDRLIVWPENNYMDFSLESLIELKNQRNKAKNEGAGVGYGTLYTGRDPNNERNSISVLGNPTLSDVRVMLIGVRNNSSTRKDGTVWINELRVTEFNEDGGWAAKANVNLGVSDVATLNVGAHVETAGFGGVDQSLNDRRLDDYQQYNIAVQTDLGRFLPEKVALKAPIFYSMTQEKTTPKYNPLDQDVLLKDALNAETTEEARDSINSFAVEHTSVQNFSLSGVKFDVKSETPMPWDPSNFVLNFSFSKRSKVDPTTEYENTNDYRGSFGYNYTPYVPGLKPFGWIKSKDKNLKFFKDWELNYLPNNISFLTTMSRYYYEQQIRSEVDAMFQLPVSVNKNFIWDRQFNLSWNITKQLNFNFTSNTSARIEETVGAVNRKLFPDRYKEWKDTIWQSIRSMGTPWSYNQTFTASYKAPFNRIPVLDFLTASLSYNSTYRWDRGATIEGISVGNTIASQSNWSADGRVNFESIYKKIPFLKDVDKRFGGSRGGTQRARKPKHYERSFTLTSDTTMVVRHNLRTNKVKIKATTADGNKYPIKTRVIDANSIEILTQVDTTLNIIIDEIMKDQKNVGREILEYATRLIMTPRSVSAKYKRGNTLSIPLFAPNIGDIFGQSTHYGPMSPGLDFAFGFADKSYIDKALDRGWLITDNGQTSPAVWSNSNEINLEASLEPFKGFKINLTWNRTHQQNNQVQFMYAGAPTSMAGSYTKTHWALASALRGSSPDDGYNSEPFNRFLDYIPVVRDRLQAGYVGVNYPTTGFLKDSPHAGAPFDPAVGGVSPASSDVLIPAFVAAYSGKNPNTIYTDPFPSFAAVLPNWRITYDGLINFFNLREKIKSFTLSHAYQCTYSVGSFTSFLNYVAINDNQGFVYDEASGQPLPSSPFNIASVAITERFAPLIGASVTLKNNMQFNAEYRDQRTLTLNASAGQVVEATTSGLTFGAGYTIVGFNTILKMKGSQQGVSNDLTMNAEFSLQNTRALIRRIETATAQPTSGTRTLNINFTANYVVSKKLTLGMYFDHQVNTPVVTTSSYPTSNSSYGISVNFNLAR